MMNNHDPILPSNEGRDPSTGRFVPGWKGGTGNPQAAKVARMRATILEAIGVDDGARLKAVIAAMLDKAESGDVQAARLVVEYAIGKPLEHDMLERVESLESMLTEREQTNAQDPSR